MNLISQDYLIHYGVKGMKWGVRHDPERVGSARMAARKQYKKAKKDALLRYAKRADKLEKSGKGNDLDANMRIASQYDAERKKAKQDYQNAKKDNPLLTPEQKQTAKKIAIGAAVVAGTALATYGGYKVSKLAKTRADNQAAVGRFLETHPEVANSVLSGSHYNTIRNRKGLSYTDMVSKSTKASIKDSIKGPSLKGSTSTVQVFKDTVKTPRDESFTMKNLDIFSAGVNGRDNPYTMTKEQKKYYINLYKNHRRAMK